MKWVGNENVRVFILIVEEQSLQTSFVWVYEKVTLWGIVWETKKIE